MIVLFHGENLAESRKALLKLKGQFKTIKILSPKAAADVEELIRVSETYGMFSPSQLLIVEGGKEMANQERLLKYLKQKPDSTTVAFWFGEKLAKSAPLLKLIRESGGDVAYFKGGQGAFPLLDALGLRRRQAFLELQNLLNAGESPLFLLSMMVYHFRGLLKTKYGVPANLHPFVRQKMHFQAKKFQLTELEQIYRCLLDLERAGKTGTGSFSTDLMLLIERITWENRQ